MTEHQKEINRPVMRSKQKIKLSRNSSVERGCYWFFWGGGPKKIQGNRKETDLLCREKCNCTHKTIEWCVYYIHVLHFLPVFTLTSY